MSYAEVISLPVKTFWMFSKNVTRIDAEEKQELLRISILSQGSTEQVQEFSEQLSERTGSIGMEDVVEDYNEFKEGVSELKRMLLNV